MALAGSLHCAGCSDINKSCNCLTKHGFGPAGTKQTLQTSDRGLDAVDHCCQNYSGLNQDATHVENITVAPAKPWLCAVLIQAPSHASRTSTGGAAEVFCSITAARLQSYFRLFGLGPWHGHCWLKSLSKASGLRCLVQLLHNVHPAMGAGVRCEGCDLFLARLAVLVVADSNIVLA